MQKTLLCINLLFLPALSLAMEEEQFLTPYNSINGQPITSANIGTMLPAIPEDLQDLASDWMSAHPSSILEITDIPNPLNLDTLMGSYELGRRNDLLGVNESISNLVCNVDGNHKIKMAGLLNKVRSLALSAQKDSGYKWQNFKEIDYTALDPQTPTYQTISYAGHYHLLTKAIREHNLYKIKTPETYFAHRPGRPLEYNDDNYVVVQKTVPNVVNLATQKDADKYEIVSTFGDEMLNHQHKATRLAMLWNMAGNMLVNPQDPTTIHVSDLEQPNNSKSHLFFYKGKQGDWKRWWDAKTGLEEMQKLYDAQGSTHQQNQWKRLTVEWNQQEENLPYQ